MSSDPSSPRIIGAKRKFVLKPDHIRRARLFHSRELASAVRGLDVGGSDSPDFDRYRASAVTHARIIEKLDLPQRKVLGYVQKVYEVVRQMEKDGFGNDEIAERLQLQVSDLSDYEQLLNKAEWGRRLVATMNGLGPEGGLDL